MNLHLLSVEQIRNIPLNSPSEALELASMILEEQLIVHRQMIEISNNVQWQELSDRHFYLRKLRREILHKAGIEIMKAKRSLSDNTRI